MNKRRNKSVTKTKHRVQKTKRNRRLNKNRSVKGIRGNNKTKVVGKRRNIVQRGGGDINDLVGRIFALNRIIDLQERSYIIEAILRDITPENFFQQADEFNPPNQRKAGGVSLLYAACRLENPSVELVEGILAKMKHESKGFSLTKFVTKAPRSVTMYTIIPNGVSNGSYPQHAAVQAAKDILEGLSKRQYSNHDDLFHIQRIVEILKMLKKYDDELAEHIAKEKKVMTPRGLVTSQEYTHTPLMDKKNRLPNGSTYTAYTAYDEYVNRFGTMNSVRFMIQQAFPIDITEFDRVLAPTGPVSVAAGSSAGASVPVAAAAGWEERFDHTLEKPFWYNNDTKEITWNNPQKTGNKATAGITSATVAGHPNPSQSGDPPLPPGWEAKTDPKTGLIYYANQSLNTTQWETPSHTGSVAAPSTGAAYQTPQQYNVKYAEDHLKDGYYNFRPYNRHAIDGVLHGFNDAKGNKYYFNDIIARQLVDNEPNAKDVNYYFGDKTNPRIFFRYLDEKREPAMIFNGNIYKLFRENLEE